MVPSVLTMYTIYQRPVDLPDAEYAVRIFFVGAGTTEQGPLLGTASTLSEARALIPASADHCLPRDVVDDPVIVETWL